MRLVIVVPSLGMGGAERVAQALASGFTDRGHDVLLVTTTSRPDYYTCDPRVERLSFSIELPREDNGLWTWVRSVKRALEEIIRLRQWVRSWSPATVISFLPDVNVLSILLFAREAPVIVTEHNDPQQEMTRPWVPLLRRLTYPRARQVVVVSQGLGEAFAWVPRSRLVVVGNPISDEVFSFVRPTRALDDRRLFVAMGRLVDQKGFDLLLRAFAVYLERSPEYRARLTILGEGPLRAELERLADELEISDCVELPGARQRPWETIGGADVFVLSSRHEGLSNALLEALAAGTPVVAFDCPYGPADIVEHGENGFIVPAMDVDALADAMVAASDETTLRSLREQARSSVSRWREVAILDDWEALLRTVSAGNRRDQRQKRSFIIVRKPPK